MRYMYMYINVIRDNFFQLQMYDFISWLKESLTPFFSTNILLFIPSLNDSEKKNV